MFGLRNRDRARMVALSYLRAEMARLRGAAELARVELRFLRRLGAS